MNNTLAQLDAVLAERKHDSAPDTSYVASLYRSGLEKILRKVSEEATETLLAAVESERDISKLPHLVEEVADLWFHSLVALSYLGSDSTQVLAVLKKRMKHDNTTKTGSKPVS